MELYWEIVPRAHNRVYFVTARGTKLAISGIDIEKQKHLEINAIEGHTKPRIIQQLQFAWPFIMEKQKKKITWKKFFMRTRQEGSEKVHGSAIFLN